MKIEIPEKKKLIFECVIPIRWGDMDAMKHLNNASYFRYMETCRIDWFQSLGRGLGSEELDGGCGILIVNAFCNFYRQLEYPGDVLMKMYVSDPGRSSFESWNTMERTDQPGVIYAAGGATTVWSNFKEQKSAPLPDWLRALIT
jgi:acyl-CoA thioester hydrolase